MHDEGRVLSFGSRGFDRNRDLDIDSIALHYPIKGQGDSVGIGDVVCVSMEDEPTARVVGFMAPGQPGMRMILRFFAPGDGWIPSGEYRRAGMCWPWRGHAEAKRRATAPARVHPAPDAGGAL